MKDVSATALTAIAGCCLLATWAAAGEPGPSGEFAGARLAGHIYINVATGERVVTPVHTSRIGDLYWENDDVLGSCSEFLELDLPTRDEMATGHVKFGASVAHWGDILTVSLCPTAYVDGFDIAYATNVGDDPTGAGVPRFNLRASFFNEYDGEVDPGGSHAVKRFELLLADIAGGDATLGTSLFAAWIYTVDLEGSAFLWTLDSFDGIDIGYVYSFEQNQSGPKGISGPLLVRPASLGGGGDAFGCPDLLEWFNDTAGERTGFAGSFWFGGGDCSAGRPFASTFMNLYGSSGGGGGFGCAAIDYSCDGLIDFTDYLEFLNRYETHDPFADLNHDGIFDFADYLEFLNLYDACTG